MISLYRFDSNTRLIEQGECDCKTAFKIFEQCGQNSVLPYTSVEEEVAATSFGLSKSKKDFIEITCNGNNTVSIHSDRLCYPSSWRRAFISKRWFLIQGDKDKGMEVIRDYFSLDREQFEAKYQEFLSLR